MVLTTNFTSETAVYQYKLWTETEIVYSSLSILLEDESRYKKLTQKAVQ
jgi:hypothetical protein